MSSKLILSNLQPPAHGLVPSLPKGSRENEALGLVRVARRDEFGNHSGNTADKNGREKAEHVLSSLMIGVDQSSFAERSEP